MRGETRRAAWVEINIDALKSNYRKIKEFADHADIIAAIKADANGHGATKVAWELIKEGVNYLAVATLSEAVSLRSSGIRTPIVLLSPTPRENVKDVIDLGIIPVVTTYTDAFLLSDISQKISPKNTPEIFIALDTGMGRIGFINNEESIVEIAKISSLPGIHVKGFFSHFASSEIKNDEYTYNQINNFNVFIDRIKQNIEVDSYSTIANSAGLLQYPDSIFDAVRPGLILFGLHPSESTKEKIDLSPVMSIKANIVYLKKVPMNFAVGYDSTFITSRESIIASIPLGYADGLPRLLSNKGRVLVNGEYAPIVGNVCMDQTMIDVTEIPGVKEYDEAVIMGSQNGKTISAEEIAGLAGTINYEVATRFGQRLPKIYLSK